MLPGGHLVYIEAPTTQQALLIIRRDYGVKAHQEAWLVE